MNIQDAFKSGQLVARQAWIEGSCDKLYKLFQMPREIELTPDDVTADDWLIPPGDWDKLSAGEKLDRIAYWKTVWTSDRIAKETARYHYLPAKVRIEPEVFPDNSIQINAGVCTPSQTERIKVSVMHLMPEPARIVVESLDINVSAQVDAEGIIAKGITAKESVDTSSAEQSPKKTKSIPNFDPLIGFSTLREVVQDLCFLTQQNYEWRKGKIRFFKKEKPYSTVNEFQIVVQEPNPVMKAGFDRVAEMASMKWEWKKCNVFAKSGILKFFNPLADFAKQDSDIKWIEEPSDEMKEKATLFLLRKFGILNLRHLNMSYKVAKLPELIEEFLLWYICNQ